MGEFIQKFPSRDGVCEEVGPMMRYLHYYSRSGVNNIWLGNRYIGRQPAEAEEAIELADRYIGMAPRTSDLPHPCFAVAATVVRLCTSHEEGAQIEIEQRVVVMPPGGPERRIAKGTSWLQSGQHNHWGVNLRDIETNPHSPPYGLYLPRDDVSGFNNEHEVVVCDRGGYSHPIMVGLLGDEVFVEREVLPVERVA